MCPRSMSIVGAINRRSYLSGGLKNPPVIDGSIIMLGYITKNNTTTWPIQV
jgi:hypothetical protein